MEEIGESVESAPEAVEAVETLEGVDNDNIFLEEDGEIEYNKEDIASMGDDSFEALRKKILEPSFEDLDQVEVERAEPDLPSEEQQALTQEGNKDKLPEDPDDIDPQLQSTLEQVNQSYRSVLSQEQSTIERYNQLRTRANELAEDNPRESAKLDREAEALEGGFKNLQEQKRALQTYSANLQIVPKRVPVKYMNPDLIAKELEESHGYTPEQAIDHAKRVLFERPASEVIALATSAFYGDALRKILPEYQKLLQGQKPAAQPKRSTNEVAKLINKAKSIPKGLKPTASSPPVADISSEQLASMNDEQFEILKKQVLGNG